jgi:hypothetical protein
MAVSVDATATADVHGSGMSATLNTLTVGSGTNRALIVPVVFNADPGTVTMKWGSQTMALIVTRSSTGTDGIAQVYGLVAPTSGAQSLVVTTTITIGDIYLDAMSFTGVDQTGGATSFPNSTSASVTTTTGTLVITTTTGNYTFSCLSTFSNETANNQTLLRYDHSGAAVNYMSQYAAGASSSVTHTFTLGSAPGDAPYVGTDIKAAAATASPFVSNVSDLPPRGFGYSKWSDWTNKGLTTLPKQSTTKPFLQTDWPVPYPVNWFRGWQEAGNTQIPFQNFTKPFKQTEWPNPYPVQWYQSWTEVGTLPTPSTTKPFNQSDWPNPQPVVWYRNWIELGTLPTPSTQKPFNQSDYPNPYPVTWYRSIEGLGNSLRAITQNPFFQTDWPNPQPVTWYRSWEEPGNSVLPQPSTTFPFVQTDYPNPPRVIWDRFWSQSPAQPLVTNPFFQLDWPNPPRTVWYQSLTVPGNALLPIGNPFFQNVDAPLPTVPQPIDQTWIQNLVEFFQANTFPFSQTDWENPPPVYWFRDYNQNLVLYLPVGQKPFSQTDWPLTQAQRPIDQTWLQTLALNLPTPPPPVQVIGGGHQWTEADVKRAAAQWLNVVRWNGGSTASFFKR